MSVKISLLICLSFVIYDFNKTLGLGCHKTLGLGCHKTLGLGCHKTLGLGCHKTLGLGCHKTLGLGCQTCNKAITQWSVMALV
jgi:hypothetical protein